MGSYRSSLPIEELSMGDAEQSSSTRANDGGDDSREVDSSSIVKRRDVSASQVFEVGEPARVLIGEQQRVIHRPP